MESKLSELRKMFNSEFIDELVVATLQEAWYSFNSPNWAVFSLDPVEDKIICNKHKEAIELLINWFGTPDQIDEFNENKS